MRKKTMTKNPFHDAYGDFKLTMPIKKSYEKDIDGVTHMYIAGLASGVGLDHHGERMAKSAIDAFAKAVEEGVYLPNGELSLIPLRSGHRKEWDDILGYVTKAEIDSDYNLWIEAELDETSSTARDLFAKLNAPPQPKKPLQLGFSVGGKIKKAGFELDATTKSRVRVIEDVLLREISVVGSPAYPTAYVEALEKSVNWDEISEQVQESDMTKDTDVQKSEPIVDQTDETEQKTDDVVKADEAAHTSTETEVVETKVEKSEEAAADPQAELKTQIADLSKSLTTLTETVNALSEKINKSAEEVKTDVETVVEKAEEKVEEESTEKSLAEQVAEAITGALNTFKTENLDPLVSDMQAVKKSVEEIGGESLDKSVAVRTAKEEGDVFEKFTQEVEKTKNPIGAAVRLGYRGQ
jgi:HK97 family phage prohead protease